MGNHLRKRLRKLERRKNGYARIKGKMSKKGNSAFKEPGSLNPHKQG